MRQKLVWTSEVVRQSQRHGLVDQKCAGHVERNEASAPEPIMRGPDVDDRWKDLHESFASAACCVDDPCRSSLGLDYRRFVLGASRGRCGLGGESRGVSVGPHQPLTELARVGLHGEQRAERLTGSIRGLPDSDRPGQKEGWPGLSRGGRVSRGSRDSAALCLSARVQGHVLIGLQSSCGPTIVETP